MLHFRVRVGAPGTISMVRLKKVKIQEHKALFRKLLKRLDKLITMLRQLDIVLVINMELPKLCSYWKNYFVRDFLMKYEMVKYNCDGCMFGVLDKDGNLLDLTFFLKSCTSSNTQFNVSATNAF